MPKRISFFMICPIALMIFLSAAPKSHAGEQATAQLAQWQRGPGPYSPPASLNEGAIIFPDKKTARPSFEQPECSSSGSAINRFLAFGCRLNYQLLNWVLSDKCEIGGTASRESSYR